jgi:polyhydroxyalkanoate synthesis regulator phasin
MNNYKKFINDFANLLQTGILTAKDIKLEATNILKFKIENIKSRFNISSKDELETLKKKIDKLNLEIKELNNLIRKR